MNKVQINSDMGEGFGLYQIGDDQALMPIIDAANVACGFHASDPMVMRKTVRLAREHGVAVGAHPSLPDLQGFGRREMAIGSDELTAAIIYQTGALKAFLEAEGMTLSHIKPHGALYSMAARDERIANAVADGAAPFGVPIYGLPNTFHESVCAARGLGFIAEFFVDLDYDAEGQVIITRTHDEIAPEQAAERAYRAVTQGLVRSIDGHDVAIRAQTLCVHSDTPNAVAIATTLFEKLAPIRESSESRPLGGRSPASLLSHSER